MTPKTTKDVNDLLEPLDSLEDGIYDVTSISYMQVPYNPTETTYNEIQEFITTYPKAVIASSYETDTTLLLAHKPKKFTGKTIGSGFNYGSTNIIQDCPQSLLILAEND